MITRWGVSIRFYPFLAALRRPRFKGRVVLEVGAPAKRVGVGDHSLGVWFLTSWCSGGFWLAHEGEGTELSRSVIRVETGIATEFQHRAHCRERQSILWGSLFIVDTSAVGSGPCAWCRGHHGARCFPM